MICSKEFDDKKRVPPISSVGKDYKKKTMRNLAVVDLWCPHRQGAFFASLTRVYLCLYVWCVSVFLFVYLFFALRYWRCSVGTLRTNLASSRVSTLSEAVIMLIIDDDSN